MIRATLAQVAEAVGGSLAYPRFADVTVIGAEYDSRKTTKDCLYIPLPGERVDGHDFVESALSAGAAAAFWEADRPLPATELPLVLVEDALLAMHALAAWYRMTLSAKVVGITGNNGKTMTKDIVAALVSQRFRTVKTQGNQNNEVGLPYTVLHLPADTEVAVLEMGTERLGELDMLTSIAPPDVGILLNVGDAHLDCLFTMENAALAKIELAEGTKADGVLFVNGDDPMIARYLPDASVSADVFTFGETAANDHRFSVERLDETGLTIRLDNDADTFTLPALGAHNAWNLTAAVLAARALGVTDEQIRAALPHVDYTSMRQELKQMNGFTVLDDSYKSNTDSLVSALRTVRMLPYEHKILVLADFLGTGDDEAQKHAGMADHIDPNDVQAVFTTGPLMRHLHEALLPLYPAGTLLHTDDRAVLIEAVRDAVQSGSLVLVKGSRDFHLEDVIEALEQAK